LAAITSVPRKASAIPKATGREIRSCSRIGESRATNSGAMETRTTELATLVKARDVIHVAKCSASSAPENPMTARSRRLSAARSAQCQAKAKSTQTDVAITIRQATTKSDGDTTRD